MYTYRYMHTYTHVHILIGVIMTVSASTDLFISRCVYKCIYLIYKIMCGYDSKRK